MEFGDLLPRLNKIIQELVAIRSNTNGSECCAATTSAGLDTSVPAGFSSVAIVQTSAGSTNITLSDGSVFTLDTLGEVFVDAGGGKSLPAYVISGSASWKWHAIK